MFRLALTLFGAHALIRRWKIFFAAGVLAVVCGCVVLVDLVDGVADIASWVFGAVLLTQGVIEILVGSTQSGVRRRFEMLRGAAMVVFAGLVLDFPWENAIAAGVIFAAAFTFNGLIRIASSWFIRHAGWRKSQMIGWGYLLMALLMATSWPVPPSMNVSVCMGLALIASGCVLARGAARLRRLPPDSRLADIGLSRLKRSRPEPGSHVAGPASSPSLGEQLVVHVWTASHEMQERISLPLIDRYFVALSRKGVVSTGHVAMECGPGLYISHHPQVRLSISQQNLASQVRATQSNDHPGMWLPSYAQEAAATRDSAFRIRFRIFNPAYLQAFWSDYRQDDTYNLTRRNCSVVVTQGIDAALEGVFSGKPFWRTLFRLAVHPDVWLAGSIRVRAESIAWTPGLAMDYAIAIRRITHPQHDLDVHLSRWWKARRRHTAMVAPKSSPDEGPSAKP